MKKYKRVPEHLKHFVSELEPYRGTIKQLIVNRDKVPADTFPAQIVQLVGLYDKNEIDNGGEMYDIAEEFTEKMGYFVQALKGSESADPVVIGAILDFLGGSKQPQQKGIDLNTILLIGGALILIVILAVKL